MRFSNWILLGTVVVAIAGGWLLLPRRPPKTSRAGASIRVDDTLADAIATHRKKPLPPESSDVA